MLRLRKFIFSNCATWGKSSGAPIFFDSTNTNRAVVQKASSIAYPYENAQRRVASFSEHHHERRARLLWHIIRAQDTDPLRQVSLEPQSANRVQYGKKRCGRPRQNWLHYAKKLNLQHYEEGPTDDNHIWCGLAKIFLIHPLRLGYANAVFVLTIKSNYGRGSKVIKASLKFTLRNLAGHLLRPTCKQGRPG